MKRTIKLWLLVSIIGLTVSCTKDLKEEVDNLLRPIPTGIVLMPSESVLQNGSTLLLPFRVNPSDYQVTLDKLHLDVAKHDITRSSYVTSVDEYTLESVEPHKGSDGEVKNGEWIAKIKIKDGAYYSTAAFALVLDYTDANNKQVSISSSTTNINTRVKLTEQMVKAESTFASSYQLANGTPIPSYIKIVPCPISEGSSTLFDMNDVIIKSVQLTGETASCFDLNADKVDPFCFHVTPNYLFGFPDEQTRFITADIQFTLADANSGDIITKQVSIKYYRTEYMTPATEISIAAIEKGLTEESKPIIGIPMAEALANIGVTADLFKGVYPPTFRAATLSFYNLDGTTATSSFAKTIVSKNENDASSPETDILQLKFFGKPKLGDYYVAVELDYRNPYEEQSRIHALIKFTVRFVE